MKFPSAICIAIALSVLPIAAASAAPPSASQFYINALEKTQVSAMPAFVTYSAGILAKGGHYDLSYNAQSKNVTISEDMESNSRPEERYQVSYRESDRREFIRIDHDRWHNNRPTAGPARLILFDPTWNAVRYWSAHGNPFGLFGESGASTDHPKPAVPSMTLNGKPLKTIAIVSAVGAGFYTVHDEGATMCDNGDPGHMLHLVARGDPLHHPLTDATVDLRTGTFCMMRFSLNFAKFPFALSGDVEIHFGMQGKYLVANEADIHEAVHAFGLQARRLSVRIRYSNYRFPATLAPSSFPTSI